MAINTDLNVTPYFDDYNEEKNFHRVLFRPAVPIQARELTQLQTILQKQVERFGDNIYQQGTIIKGCSFHFDNHYFYVKINDLQVDGQPTVVSRYANGIIKDSSNLTSVIVNQVQGLESQDPDLSTLYFKYINTGIDQSNNDKRKYSNGDVLTIYDKIYSLQSIQITSPGTLYKNTDTIVITSATGSGASANLITFSNGQIRDVVVTDGGSGYTDAPVLTITTSTGSSGALTALNYIAQVKVANSSFANAVGTGFAVSVTDGVIYQDGNFVRVEEQTVIVDKYSKSPNNVSLGFVTTSSIVNTSVDSTLLDNAQGYSNYTAPGAHRLKLTSNLISIPISEVASKPNYLSLLEFSDGNITKRKTDTSFNSVGFELAKRTREESGNYVVRPFDLFMEDKTSNNTHLNLSVGSGIGYVDGFRVECTGVLNIPVRKSNNTFTELNQTINTNFGNYIVIDQVLGNFDFSAGSTINLRNAANTAVTGNFGGDATTPGSVIGTALAKSLVYSSGTPGTPTCQYRLYLYNISMISGSSFSSARAVQVAGGVADIVLEDGKAVLKETDFDTLIYNSGASAVSFFSNEKFIYRKVQSASILSSGIASVSLSGSEEFPYTASSTLNDTQELDFIVIPSANAYSTVNLTGTVTTSGNVVSGVGTSTNFIVDLDVGDYIKFSGNNSFYRVSTISTSNSMTIEGSTGPALTGNTISYAFPKNIPIRLNRGTANVSIDSNGNTAFVYVGSTISGTTSATVYLNSKVDPANQRAKSVIKSVYVKLSTDKLSQSLTGPWNIGIPDAYKLIGVYVGSSNSYVNTSTNYASSFELITGQTDNIYGLASIRKKPGSSLSLTATNCLLVCVDCFTHGAGYYLSTESYPVDDVTTSLPANKIRTEDIPYYLSPNSKKYYNLRDSIDFRPIVANTANVSATTVAGATIDPANTVTLAGNLTYPAPNESFEADITYFLSRNDTVVIDPHSNISIIEGQPSKNPIAPRPPDGTMVLGTITIPPLPSLSPKSAKAAGRPEYSTLIKPDQIRGYNMKDIQAIEDRINKLEYYSLLNTLEKSASDLLIPSEVDSTINRFKNGFFAESFSSYDISNVDSPEYNILVDVRSSSARPTLDTNPVELVVNTAASSNVTFVGEYGLLNYSEVSFLSQDIANKARNLAQGGYEFFGNMLLYPKYDNFQDVTISEVNVNIDLESPLNSLIKSINDNVTLKGTNKVTTVVASDFARVVNPTQASTGLDQRTVSTTVIDTIQTLNAAGTKVDVASVGSFVNDFSLRPYIRAQDITFAAVGLRPNTRHYVIFDKKNVDQYCRQGEVPSLDDLDPKGHKFSSKFKFKPDTTLGTPLRTDSNGTLVGVFSVPKETFFVGERELLVTDFDGTDLDASLSSATVNFNAYNFSVDETSLSITTKSPQNIAAVSTSTTSVSSVVQNRIVARLPPPPPPIQCCCFIAGTKIAMADGSYKNIEDVMLGDVVLGKDRSHNKVLKFLRPTLGATGATMMAFNGGTPFMTSDHPVFIRGYGWKSFDPEMTQRKYSMPVGRYQVGDIIETPDGTGFEIKSIEEYNDQDQDQIIYNFLLSGNHTYIANGLVVHNKGGGGGGCVPIAQTFKIFSEGGTDGVFLTSMKLYFKTKDASQPVILSIRNVQNGYPDSTYLTEKIVSNSDINVSEDASLATTITFDTPVFLKNGLEYCFVVVPGNHSPDFTIYSGEVGIPDLTTPSKFFNKNWGSGVMFLSTNDTTFTAYQQEDIKFEIFVAEFSKDEGKIVLENDNYEFLSLSSIEGSFVENEEVAQKSNTYLTGLITGNTSSAIVNTTISQTGSLSVGDYVLIVYANNEVLKTGTVSGNTTSPQINGISTLFSSEYTVGDYLIIDSQVRSVNSITNNTVLILDAPLTSVASAVIHYGVTDKSQITSINSVNSTSITLKNVPLYNITNTIPLNTNYAGAVQKVVRGTIDRLGVSDSIVLNNSTAANASFLFESGKKIIGETSQAVATISSVDNKPVNFIESYLRYGVPLNTSMSFNSSIKVGTGEVGTRVEKFMVDGISNPIDYVGEIQSKSNEISSGSKSVMVSVDLGKNSSNKLVSPFLDVQPAGVIFKTNEINNVATDETTGYGDALIRYISKNVVLSEGLDAEDIKVFVTAFKPPQSSILVYAKILSSDDLDPLDLKDWTLLEQTTEGNLYSNSLDENNYIEYEYSFSKTQPFISLDGITTTSSNTTITGEGTSFSSSLVSGDLVKIIQNNNLTSYDIGVVDAVTNNTHLTVKNNVSFTSGTSRLEKVTQKKAAFKYNRDTNIVNYFDSNLSIHSGYKIFAIKIVLLSSSSKYVPILRDVRALAVSI